MTAGSLPLAKLALCLSFLCLSFTMALPRASLAQSPPSEAGDGDDDAKFGLADLPAYHRALSGRAATDQAAEASDGAHPAAEESAGVPADVVFHNLWDHSEDWEGRRVTISGRVVRIFRQGPVGDFPPLVEAWVTTPAGNLFCVHFPVEAAASGSPALGDPVKFSGTYLKLVRYAAGDQPRLAPLIAGDHPPSVIKEAGLASRGSSNGDPAKTIDPWPPGVWMLVLVLGAGVLLLLVHGFARGRIARSHAVTASRMTKGVGGSAAGVSRPRDDDPPLEFLDLDQETAHGPAVPKA